MTTSTRLAGAMLVLGTLNPQINAQTTVADVSAQDSGTSKPALVALGPDERIWSTGDPQSNRRIVEVGTGMNFWDGETWAPSDPTFDVADDAFAADRLQFPVRLSANLNTIGAVTVVTPDGLTLHSTPVGIGLFDPVSGKSAIIAAATNTFGVLVGDSRVVYENAFAGICADVIYTIDRSSFSQDVVITGRLDPADWGFPPTARIQIYTEFYSPPKPDRILRPIYIEQDQGVRNRKVSPNAFRKFARECAILSLYFFDH